jgi:branched-chain amino acid aminotransferase
MNHYHVTRAGSVVIPTFTETILRSITSESVLELGKRELGVEAGQARIPVEQFLDDVRSGAVTEAGGLGTAAVVSAVGTYVFDDGTQLHVGDGQIGPHTRRIYEVLTGIQRGKRAAPEGWLFQAPHLESTRPARARKATPARRPKSRPASPARPARGAAKRKPQPASTARGASRRRR